MENKYGVLYPGAAFLIIQEDVDGHVANFRLKCSSRDEFREWLKEHEELSGITYRVQATTPCRGQKVIYKAHYRCQHNTYPSSHIRVKKSSPKNTDCKGKLKISITSTISERNHSKDIYRREFPSLVEVQFKHNHTADEAKKYKDVSETCKEKFVELFNRHFLPAKALEHHKQNLMEEYKEYYKYIADDRAICPNINWVRCFYYRNYQKKFGKREEGKPVPTCSLNVPEERNSTTMSTNSSEEKVIKDQSNDDLIENVIVSTEATEPLDLPGNKWNDVDSLIEVFQARLTEGLRNNPQQFKEAISTMLTQLHACRTESALISAMNCFGKGNTVRKRKPKADVKKNPQEKSPKRSKIQPFEREQNDFCHENYSTPKVDGKRNTSQEDSQERIEIQPFEREQNVFCHENSSTPKANVKRNTSQEESQKRIEIQPFEREQDVFCHENYSTPKVDVKKNTHQEESQERIEIQPFEREQDVFCHENYSTPKADVKKNTHQQESQKRIEIQPFKRDQNVLYYENYSTPVVTLCPEYYSTPIATLCPESYTTTLLPHSLEGCMTRNGSEQETDCYSDLKVESIHVL